MRKATTPLTRAARHGKIVDADQVGDVRAVYAAGA